jgi:AcrR family transcriptional regulator
VAELAPRKLPRQARSRATFDAVVEACARLLDEGDLASLTTNRIAERAGVSIGSLYEFFPSREAILMVLAERRLEALREGVEAALERASALPDWEALSFLLDHIVGALRRERRLFQVLLREARFLLERPETQRQVARLFGVGLLASRRARGRLALPRPELDAWLVGRMLAAAALDVALADVPAAARTELTRELARLAFRMLQGRDPDSARAR